MNPRSREIINATTNGIQTVFNPIFAAFADVSTGAMIRAVNPEFSGIGWGLIGSILATLAVTVPSFFLVLYSAHFIRRHNESGAVKAVFSGLRPVVVGLIASAAIMLMNAANFSSRSDEADISGGIDTYRSGSHL